MKYLLALISISLLVSCDHNKSGTATDKLHSGANFTAFLDTIPNQSLPLYFSCGLSNGTKSAEGFKTFKQFIPKSADRIFGTVKSNNEHYKLVIFGYTGDDIYPIIFSFNNEGIVTDSLSLILHACGAANKHEIPQSFVSIGKDLTITLTDTTRLIHIPEGLNSIDVHVVDSLRVSKVVMRVDQNGKFVKQ